MINHESANAQALEIFQTADPVVRDIQRALDVIPGLTENMLLHAGAPIAPQRMCGPMRGALAGALLYEGRATDLASAYRLLDSGEVHVDSCHNHAAVAPMAGVISPSMPVWVIENRSNGALAYSNINEGPGHTLRYGANSPDVIERLRWMETTFAPRLREAVLRLEGLAIFPLVAEALEMGDECHSRNHAALTLLIQKFIPALFETNLTSSEICDVLDFMIGRDYFFLNLTMAACKSAWLEAEKVPDTSLVTAFSRNGVEFAIRVRGRWFTAESPVVDGHFFAGYTQADANRDIGDSAITEASGLGGFAAGAAPAVIDFIGGSAASLMELQREMYAITLSESPHFRLPALEYRGTPTGVDVLKVLQTGIRPFITTGVAHREAGVGQIGAGRVRAPLGCFQRAAEQFALHP